MEQLYRFVVGATDVTVVVDETSRDISVTEGDSVSLCARMMGRADFNVSASFQPYASPGSALAGEDFAMAPQELQFPANSADRQCVFVQTMENSIVEGTEQFWVRLTITGNGNPRISLGPHVSANVTIEDDDCEFTAYWVSGHVICPPCSCGCWV